MGLCSRIEAAETRSRSSGYASRSMTPNQDKSSVRLRVHISNPLATSGAQRYLYSIPSHPITSRPVAVSNQQSAARSIAMEEDSIDSSESFIALSLSSKGEQQELKQEDSHEEEKEATEQKDEDEEAGEESSGGGIVSRLISNLSISVPGLSAGDEPQKEQSKEEKGSASAGLSITHLLPKLPVALPDEQSPAADEACLLISIIED